MKTFNILSLSLIIFIFSSFSLQKKSILKTQFTVYGNCEMCKTRIESAVKSLKGIKKAKWNVDSKIISVKYDESKVSLDEIHKAISEMGYKTEKLAATKKGYSKLPDCCKVKDACEIKKDEK